MVCWSVIALCVMLFHRSYLNPAVGSGRDIRVRMLLYIYVLSPNCLDGLPLTVVSCVVHVCVCLMRVAPRRAARTVLMCVALRRGCLLCVYTHVSYASKVCASRRDAQDKPPRDVCLRLSHVECASFLQSVPLRTSSSSLSNSASLKKLRTTDTGNQPYKLRFADS